MSAPKQLRIDASAPIIQPRTLRRLIPELRAGGVNAVLTPVASIEGSRQTVRAIATWLELEREDALPFRIVREGDDLQRVSEAGEIGIVLHFQGAAPIEDSLDLMNAYHAMGVRVVQVTYNSANLLGDGATEDRGAGLSDLGKRAVRRMEDLGIVVDVSHAGMRTALDVLEMAGRPVIASHSNARSVCDSLRNLTDEVITGIANSGGVIGVCAFPSFVSHAKEPTLEQLLDHIDYLRALVGARHVGLGLDFADEDEDDYAYFGYDERVYPHPPWIWPRGISGPREVPNVARGLEDRGYAEDEIDGIMGGNFLRVFEAIWQR